MTPSAVARFLEIRLSARVSALLARSHLADCFPASHSNSA